jgi:hypothetical protein
MSQRCSQCGLFSSDQAVVCDCGFRLASGTPDVGSQRLLRQWSEGLGPWSGPRGRLAFVVALIVGVAAVTATPAVLFGILVATANDHRTVRPDYTAGWYGWAITCWTGMSH